jgi:hypothetical protein
MFLRIGNRQSGGRSRNLAFMGSLINNDDLVRRLGWTFTLMRMTGTPLTGASSLTAKAEIEVETRRSSLVV